MPAAEINPGSSDDWILGDDAAAFKEFATPEERLALQSQIDKVMASQIKAHDDLVKKMGEEARKQLIESRYGLSDVPFDEQMVQRFRDVLSPDDYAKYVKAAREGVAPPDNSNPRTIIELTRMAVNGDADLQDSADEALKRGLITVADYRTAINEGQQFRDPVIKTALEEIRLKTGYSEMNPNPDAAGSYIQAKKDYLSWLDSPAGQKAGEDEKIKMGSRIADNYRIAQAETLLSVPVPLMLVGSRTTPDITATAQAIQAAFESGELSQEQYDEELSRIRRMKQILDRETAETAQAAKTRSNR